MYKTLIIISLFIVNNAFSQKDSIYSNLKVGLGGSYNKTEKSNVFLMNFSTNYEIYDSSKYLMVDFNYVKSYLNIDSTKSILNDDLNLVFNYTHMKHRKFYMWYVFRYDNMYSLNIENRFQFGSGLGTYILNKKNITLNLSDGLIYQFDDGYLRNSIRLRSDIMYKIFIFSSYLNLQTSLNNFRDKILFSNYNLQIKVSKNVKFNIKIVQNIKTLDFMKNTIHSVGFDFYF